MIMRLRIGKKVLRIKNCGGVASATGLMFDDLIENDGALIYANNIWMPFCKPLDLFFLDKNFRVLETRRAAPLRLLKPKTWKIYKNEKANYCLEIKAGVVKIKKGEKIRFNSYTQTTNKSIS